MLTLRQVFLADLFEPLALSLNLVVDRKDEDNLVPCSLYQHYATSEVVLPPRGFFLVG